VFTQLAGASLEPARTATEAWRRYGNNPLQAVYTRRMVPTLRAWLEEQLPQHMVPQTFTVLEELPLTVHGAFDAQAVGGAANLAASKAGSGGGPSTALEKQTALLWTKLLDIEAVGMEDSFFDVGGHSLLATQLVSRVRETFGVHVSLRQFFEAPTIAGLCALMEQQRVAAQEETPEAGVEIGGAVSAEESLLADLDSLSEAEIDALLRQAGGQEDRTATPGPWL
jgi:acyl carrier protein